MGETLQHQEVRGWLSRLTDGGDLEALAGQSGAQLCDLLHGLELAKNALSAAQARVTVVATETLRDEAVAAGAPPSRADKGISAQLALARRESPHAGSRHVGFARAVVTEMPHLHEGTSAGLVPEWTATKVVAATACLSREHRGLVDAHLAGRFEQASDKELVAAARAKAYELDPYAFTNRGRRAARDRRVTVRPAPDVMSMVSGYLPVAQGVACYASLDAAAKALRATGDERSMDQLRADLFVQRLTGQAEADRVPIEVGLVMSDRALMGASEEAARLQGFGPVPAPYARDLVASGGRVSAAGSVGQGAPGGRATGATVGAWADPTGGTGVDPTGGTGVDPTGGAGSDRARDEALVWLGRLYADPETGVVTGQDRRRRRFTGAVRRFIVARDQVCRTPWCDAPVRHADHVVPWAAGGETDPTNGAGLCEACNYAKEATGWRHRPVTLPDGSVVIRITTPTGHTYDCHPPPVLPTRGRVGGQRTEPTDLGSPSGGAGEGAGSALLDRAAGTSPLERHLEHLLAG
ncbi:HNH endonuclease [Ornithinimicrobium cavernae]|uniref:HNH endonuclease n=1 Tax=Ornithinimicrobium cavernae TaxID=2666047 RepID=UPI000D68ED44|nr:HNH endonuclease signature motif containing protein [Ornithinimicrobium cavernae]